MMVIASRQCSMVEQVWDNIVQFPLHLIVESVRPPYNYIVSHEHLPGHIFFDKFLLALLGWEQIIGLCSKLVHIDLCLLLGCHGLCFQKATSVYIASFDRILKQPLPIVVPSIRMVDHV